MNKEMKKVSEYVTPKCRMVDIHPQSVVCQSPIDGYSPNVDVDDDEDLGTI